jgi:hypothetical protein
MKRSFLLAIIIGGFVFQFTAMAYADSQKDQQFKAIDQAAAEKKAEIEKWYRYQYKHIMQWSEERVWTLKIPDKVVGTQFTRIFAPVPYVREFSTVRSLEKEKHFPEVIDKGFNTSIKNTTTIVPLEGDDHFVGRERPPIQLDDDWPTYVTEVPFWAKEFVKLEKFKQLQYFLEEYYDSIARLKKVTRGKLLAVDKWAKEQKQLLLNPAPAPAKEQKGLVIAICYDPGNSQVFIEGTEKELVSEGDTVGGVKVVKVYEDKVLFKKGSSRWIQVVGGNPSNKW